MSSQTGQSRRGWWLRLQRRGVLRVAASYAVIAWLTLQIGDVVLDPFDFGEAAMRVLLIVVALGFPVALLLAWFFELTPQGVEVDHGAPGAPRPAVHGLRRYADVVIISVLVLVVAFLLARQGGLIEEAPVEQVVAVLPFANLSPQAEDAYFGEGLADTMIQKLGQLNELVVLASQSTFQFTGRDLDLSVVGAKLGATTIMTGSVQRSANALRVNARLVDVATGRQLWSQSYDRVLADVFAIQDEIATSVSDALQLVLSSEDAQRLAMPPTTNLTAYDAYLLGINRLTRRQGEQNIEALGYFEQAIAADPDFALSYAGLVETYSLMAWWPGEFNWSETREKAIDAANKAVVLDPQLGEAWLAQAQVGALRWLAKETDAPTTAEIEALFEQAVTLSPNNAQAYKYYSNFLNSVHGMPDDRSRQLLLTASRLDPRSGIIKVNIGEGYVERGEFATAEDWFRQSVDTADPYFSNGIVALVNLHGSRTGRLDEAARWATGWFDAYPGERRAFRTAIQALLDLGADESARELFERYDPPIDDGSLYNMPRFIKLLMGIELERALGSVEGGAQFSGAMSREFWEPDPEWPSAQHWGEFAWGLTALALADIRQGHADRALARQLAAYPGAFEDIDDVGLDVLHPPVLTAALYKLNGEPEMARTLLLDYLEWVRAQPVSHWDTEHGWTPFTILAMLGDTEAAVAEFGSMVDLGYLHEWWALKAGDFDTDYARTLADPRFEGLYRRVTDRVEELRQDYFDHPELPEGSIP